MTGPQSEPEQPLAPLCTAAAGGDPAAAERLFVLHHHRFLALATRKIGADWAGKIEAEDLLQEAYAAAWSTIAKFEYRGEDSFFRWVATIIDQRFIDRVRALRRKKRDATRESHIPDHASRVQTLAERLALDQPAASRIARRKDAGAAMIAALATLEPDHRRVLELLHLDERPIADVARELNRSEDAVRRLAGRAMEALRQGLGRASRWITLG